MKKSYLLVAILTLTSISAFAVRETGGDEPEIGSIYNCVDEKVMDGGFGATFHLYKTGKGGSVYLTVPTGETSAEVHHGYCRAVLFADELAFDCEVETENGKFQVGLYSPGSTELFASVRSELEASVLPCKKQQ